jgi:hypothetical protein
MKPFKARFSGVCPKPCKKKGKDKTRIRPGQWIVKSAFGPYRHAECAGVTVQLQLPI